MMIVSLNFQVAHRIITKKNQVENIQNTLNNLMLQLDHLDGFIASLKQRTLIVQERVVSTSEQPGGISNDDRKVNNE